MVLLFCLAAGAARADGVAVEIDGVTGARLDNVHALLSLAGDDVDADTNERTIRRLYRQAPQEIRQALEPFGYYRPTIERTLTHGDNGWKATFRIDPGQRVRLTSVVVAFDGPAAHDQAFQALRGDLDLKADQPLLHSDYENAKSRIMQLAIERGYFDAQWRVHRLAIDPAAATARAQLVLASGPRYQLGRVDFAPSPFDPDFLQRYVPFEPGDPYQATDLRQLQYGLDDSDYFERVDVEPQRKQAAPGGQVPVHVGLEPRPRNRYTFGIGYGTDTGARVSAGWKDRYINSRGHSFDLHTQIAEIGTSASARYHIPLADPAHEQLVLASSLENKEIGDGRTQQFTVGAHRVEQRGPYKGTVSLDYQYSRDKISGETTSRNLVMPGASLVYSHFNQRVYATRGFHLGAYVSGGAKTLGSDVSFLRGRLHGRGVLGLWPGGRLLVRGTIGTVKVDHVDNLPLEQRFFAGGDNSVRGFAYQSLGPTDDEGNVVGGRHLEIASVELEQLVYGNWGVAAFMDAGNAMNDWDTSLRKSAGVGLRYRTPVGVFRVDVAKAIDGSEGPRLHLSLGVDL